MVKRTPAALKGDEIAADPAEAMEDARLAEKAAEGVLAKVDPTAKIETAKADVRTARERREGAEKAAHLADLERRVADARKGVAKDYRLAVEALAEALDTVANTLAIEDDHRRNLTALTKEASSAGIEALDIAPSNIKAEVADGIEPRPDHQRIDAIDKLVRDAEEALDRFRMAHPVRRATGRVKSTSAQDNEVRRKKLQAESDERAKSFWQKQRDRIRAQLEKNKLHPGEAFRHGVAGAVSGVPLTVQRVTEYPNEENHD